jgi:general stress protein 26
VSDWKKVRDIDFAMLLTHTESGEIAGRPMSNNRDVGYDGDSFFFTWEQARSVANIERDPKVALSGAEGRLDIGDRGKKGIMLSQQARE